MTIMETVVLRFGGLVRSGGPVVSLKRDERGNNHNLDKARPNFNSINNSISRIYS